MTVVVMITSSRRTGTATATPMTQESGPELSLDSRFRPALRDRDEMEGEIQNNVIIMIFDTHECNTMVRAIITA
ncbi:hypothetical protein GBAR_LOCUS24715 [Geodia barretti]|uniref:Uncharacterized protein n=1 Tax=Geodia barretti TaxID=519541 RepID=A0AA35XAS9_GEOBA|nr:hypothetical protein GBAR_LOCUS24715 [Geodia barretti]